MTDSRGEIAFGAFHAVAAVLFCGAAYTSAVMLSHNASLLTSADWRLLTVTLSTGTIAWAVTWWAGRQVLDPGHVKDLARDPLAWSKGATVACATFILLSASLALPAMLWRHPLSGVAMTLAGVLAATSSIILHLACYWCESTKDRTDDALKAEQQMWSMIFQGTVSWTGLFISGTLLAAALGTGLSGLRDSLPAEVNKSKFGTVVLLHLLLAGVTIASTVVWILRPLHHRLQQIVAALDERQTNPG